MRTEYKIAILAVLTILTLESIALFMGVDGSMFAAAMGALGVTIGYVLKPTRVEKGERGETGKTGKTGKTGPKGRDR